MVLDFTGMVMETAVDGSVRFLASKDMGDAGCVTNVITISNLDLKTMQALGRRLGIMMSCQVRFPEMEETSR